MTRNDTKGSHTPPAESRRAIEDYQHPEITDYGTLEELTLSGNAPLSDSFGGAAGGGS
jgi:hypothetical protein